MHVVHENYMCVFGQGPRGNADWRNTLQPSSRTKPARFGVEVGRQV